MKYEITFVNKHKYPKSVQLSQTLVVAANNFQELLAEEVKDREGYWSDKDLTEVTIKKVISTDELTPIEKQYEELRKNFAAGIDEILTKFKNKKITSEQSEIEYGILAKKNQDLLKKLVVKK